VDIGDPYHDVRVSLIQLPECTFNLSLTSLNKVPASMGSIAMIAMESESELVAKKERAASLSLGDK